MQGPVILRADECRNGGGWQACQHVGTPPPEGLQIIQEPLVVAELLLDVPFEVCAQACRHRIGIGHGFGSIQRRLHERDAGTDDAVKRDQVFGVQGRDPRML